jgi:hypothetical protein
VFDQAILIMLKMFKNWYLNDAGGTVVVLSKCGAMRYFVMADMARAP